VSSLIEACMKCRKNRGISVLTAHTGFVSGLKLSGGHRMVRLKKPKS